MKTIVPILFAVAGAASLVPVVKSLVKGEPIEAVFVVLGMVFITLAVVFAAVARRKGGGGASPRNG